MVDHLLPRYPVYIPSKGRFNHCSMAQCLEKGGVPYHIVVEPQEADAYAARFGKEHILILPFRNCGLIAARNFIKDHALSLGVERHWQLDDNMLYFMRYYKGKRLYCEPGIALRICEDFTDRYENIAISGLNYEMFLPDGQKFPPFVINCHVYSCTLILNSTPFRWRTAYNDDTDMCLQVLAAGWCTVLLNVFMVKKIQTMKVKGGNTKELYQGDGRLKMARSLERLWPGVVTTDRRFQRPQHVVKDSWKKFDTPLKLKPGIDLSQLPPVDEYGMTLAQVKEVKSPRLQAIYKDWHTSEKRGENAPTHPQATEETQATGSTQALHPTPRVTTSEEES